MKVRYSTEMLENLQAFYKKVDQLTASLEKVHANRLKCQKGCHACCIDDLEVFGIEAELITTKNKPLVENSFPHMIGKCAFLGEEDECRIYEHRPFVCRTHGLPLSWLEEVDGEDVEYRDICSLNEEGEPIEDLSEEKVLDLVPLDEQLAMLQFKADGGREHRVKLRDLFE